MTTNRRRRHHHHRWMIYCILALVIALVCAVMDILPLWLYTAVLVAGVVCFFVWMHKSGDWE